jgi:hypothetical protein
LSSRAKFPSHLNAPHWLTRPSTPCGLSHLLYLPTNIIHV